MSIELITGRYGTPHINSEDVRAYQAYTVGDGRYLLHGGECSMTDANTMHIAAGEVLVDGSHVRIMGDGEDVSIENGAASYKRIDVVALHYTVTGQGEQIIESIGFVVVKGDPVDTEEEPVAPTMPVSTSILDKPDETYIPYAQVLIDGLAPQTPEVVLGKVMTIDDLSNTSRFRQLWSGSMRNPNQPMTIPAPGIGDYSLVLVRGNGMNVLLLRDVGNDPQGGAIRGTAGNYACSITVTDWAQDSITITDYIYSSHSNPTLGGTVTRNAGDWMTITGIWGIA